MMDIFYKKHEMKIVMFDTDEAFVAAGIGSDENLTPLPEVDVTGTGNSDQ